MSSALLLVALAWMYVAVMMAAAEATGPNGSVFGAIVTLLLYGVGPLAIVLYLMATPARRRLRRAREALATPEAAPAPSTEAPATRGDAPTTASAAARPPASALDPDRGGHAAGDAVAPIRKET